MPKKEEKNIKVEIAQVERKGKCLTCGKLLIKNHKTCSSCNRKKRLMKKANRRGKRKNYYLEGFA